MKKKAIFSSFLLLFFLGCATTPAVPPEAKEYSTLHIPREAGRVFRSKAATNSDVKAATFWLSIGIGAGIVRSGKGIKPTLGNL